MGSLCIIPARGGSKRIPGKNIRDFLGKPIIAYSIEAALQSGLFEEVMVSTDDDTIASIAGEFGANIPFMRSTANSSDFATTFDVIEEVINSYEEMGKHFDLVCCIYPCAPFVTSELLKSGFEKLIAKQWDAIFPVLEFGTPIQRAMEFDSDRIKFRQEDFATTRSQDIAPSYHDAGQFYWLRTEIILKERKLLTKNSSAIVISELEAQDIDNETDWKIAELKYIIKRDGVSK